MKMFNRRMMFAAMAAAGVAPLTADYAVATAFEDADYLRLRDARRDRDDREDAARRAAQARENQIMDNYLDQYVDLYGCGYDVLMPRRVDMKRSDLQVMFRNNRIDYVPNDEGTRMVPMYMGMLVNLI